ncbi:hypothetical protein [Nocardia amamiensis]|uniref:hypothetical protein n=1 Tax=Nocardia amamiensis TaxID=404578 RepID=UPI00083377E3|nr:hypothetical protein [Nocardia amamiensis]
MENEPEPGYPRNAEEAEQFITRLTFDDTAEVPPLPPTSEEIERSMDTILLKLPEEMRDRVLKVSTEHCITPAMLIRQYIEIGLAAEKP